MFVDYELAGDVLSDFNSLDNEIKIIIVTIMISIAIIIIFIGIDHASVRDCAVIFGDRDLGSMSFVTDWCKSKGIVISMSEIRHDIIYLKAVSSINLWRFRRRFPWVTLWSYDDAVDLIRKCKSLQDYVAE